MTTNHTHATPLEWWHHATRRWNYWEEVSIRNPRDQLSHDMVNEWQRQRMIAYGQMTQQERGTLRTCTGR